MKKPRYMLFIAILAFTRCADVLAAVAENRDEFPLMIDKAGVSLRFDGVGAVSGGGATSRLLVSYEDPERSRILDYLFKPNFGAALQILKVEIGGDSLAGCGAESSHMHTDNVSRVDYSTGYEWWLMVEAKKRNPDIKLYGLPWSFPGWLGTKSPYANPQLTAQYIVKWLEGARHIYNLTIDYIGVWNERPSNSTYVQVLRSAMDAAGFKQTQIVAKDGGADICNSMATDKAYADAVDVIGLHYPSDFSNFSLCHSFNKPFWASEESSSYDDANGAACWARVINSHWVLQQMTSSIMWNLVGSYYHGTNWYAESMMTADQPWSGHYWVSPVIWATAHVTQFTKVGWRYLKNRAGSGLLPLGGYYVTWVDPDGPDFTIVAVKISYEHAPCIRPHLPRFNTSAETVTFELTASMGHIQSLQVWYSNFEDGPPHTLFEKQANVAVVNGKVNLHIPVGGYFTLSSLKSGEKGSFPNEKTSAPNLPLPYKESFDADQISGTAGYFADQIGIFEVHAASSQAGAHKNVMRQMVPQTPIAWQGWGDTGPLTVLGMREWQDVTVSIDFYVSEELVVHAMPCVATRSDQKWLYAVALCVNGTGWTLSNRGPQLQADNTPGNPPATSIYQSGPLPAGVSIAGWHAITLTTITTQASGTLDGHVLFANASIGNADTGFVGVGMNYWYPVEFDNLEVDAAGPNWEPTAPCHSSTAGDTLGSRNCTTNGLSSPDQEFDLLATYQLRHAPSGLCATATALAASATITLEECDATNSNQTFFNTYSNIRNMVTAIEAVNGLVLSGRYSNGTVSLQTRKATPGCWTEWAYFPNTRQLRNQYTRDDAAGYPQCLSTCPQ
ncbi:galactocerebrosidase-like isoform X2 [Sycon ciliatum]|uniref:galactocerebrosidase-like isoform X2 n=1 Tax=Sycon ciliatum TaxID=27933 RepID=UPI0031F6802C